MLRNCAEHIRAAVKDPKKFQIRLHDPRLDLYPWGFGNQALEAKYLEYYWLTFAMNNKTLLLPLYSVCALFFYFSFLQHFFVNGLEWSTTGTDIAMALIYTFVAAGFYRRPMQSWFKKFFSACYRICMWIVPALFTVEACHSSASRSNLFLQMSVLALAGGWTCPHWIHHVLNLAGVGFIPIVWSCLYGERDMQWVLVEWTTISLHILTFGLLFSGFLCVERRRAWHDSRAATDLAPSRSPSACRRSRSPLTRSLPRVVEVPVSQAAAGVCAEEALHFHPD